MRKLHPLVRLIARLAFGLSVLAFFSFISVEMASHYFESIAEHTVRQAFTESTETKPRVRSEAVCRRSDSNQEPLSECDPIAVKAKRSLRSASCSGRGLLHIFGKQWSCVAKFTDESTLDVDVSLVLRRHHLELALPVRERDTQDQH